MQRLLKQAVSFSLAPDRAHRKIAALQPDVHLLARTASTILAALGHVRLRWGKGNDLVMKGLLRLMAVSAGVVIVASCQSSPYIRAMETRRDIAELAGKEKCGKAVKEFDRYKVEFNGRSDTQTEIAEMATDSYNYGKKTLAQCLVEAGRHEEIISQFERVCLSRDTTVSAVVQSMICRPSNGGVDAAYKFAGRANPLAANPQLVAEFEANAKYSSTLDTAVSEIYQRLVTASDEVGTPAGSLRYHQQMRDASAQAIVLVDAEIAKYQGANNPGRMQVLKDQRRASQALLSEHGGEIVELQESHQAAEKIRAATSGILDTVAVLAATQTGAAAQGGAVPGMHGDRRFPHDIVYVNGPGLEVDRYYKPLGCVTWTPREMPGKYDLLNNCRYNVDVFVAQGPYRPDYVYGDLPRAGLRPGKTASQAYRSDELGTPIACLEVDGLLIRRKGDLQGVPDYDGHICRRHQSSNGNGVNTGR